MEIDNELKAVSNVCAVCGRPAKNTLTLYNSVNEVITTIVLCDEHYHEAIGKYEKISYKKVEQKYKLINDGIHKYNELWYILNGIRPKGLEGIPPTDIIFQGNVEISVWTSEEGVNYAYRYRFFKNKSKN